MSGPVRVVAPFRPFPPEALHHRALADFNWMSAIRMMTDSVERSCHCPVLVLTDVDTDLPMPALRYVTHERRLMLWYLEIAACYLESDAFDCDSIALDSDQLVFDDLARWFHPAADLGILARPSVGTEFQILNGVQWWAVAGKARLARFYRDALAYARQLPEPAIVWGADTLALEALLHPLDLGCLVDRAGLRAVLWRAGDVLERLSGVQIRQLRAGVPIARGKAVLDFRNTRKLYMADVYRATIGQPSEVSA